MKKTLIVFLLMVFQKTYSQNGFNANFQPLKFGGTGVTVSNKVGNGTSTGDVVLYQNIITIGNRNFDAIVKTVSITNGSFTAFDQTAASGTGFSGNQGQWFSPQLTFNSGGGNVVFLFTLIQGGTYNNSTKMGSRVTLNNVRINTYDIDGNGNNNSNQFNEFGGFSTSELASNTNITPTYNAALGLTKYRSNLSANTSDATDVKNRVRVTYNYMSEFSISVGAGSNGAAYFFIDFSTGSTFTSAVSTSAPELDLNTHTVGINNDTTMARNGQARFTTGQTNISNPSNQVNAFKLSYSLLDLPDSSQEIVNFLGASGGGSYPLFFATSGAGANMVIHGNTFNMNRTISGSQATITFTRQGGLSLNNAQAESFLDAMVYQNLKANPTTGNRSFQVSFNNPTFESAPATYTLNLAQQLPVTWNWVKISKTGDQTALIQWETESESNCSYFEPLIMLPFTQDWKSIGRVKATNFSSGSSYSLPLDVLQDQQFFIKIMQVDFDGNFSYSPIQKVEIEKLKNIQLNYIQSQELILVHSSKFGVANIVDQYGRILKTITLHKGDNEVDLNGYSPGLYWMLSGDEAVKFLKY